MKRFEDQISIDAPIGHVYDYVADFPRHAEWAGNGLEVTKSTEGPVAVGSVFSTTAKQFGTQREQSTITEVSPGSAFAWESKGALGLARHRFSLAGDGASTTLTKSAEIVEPTFLGEGHELEALEGHPEGPSPRPRQHQGPPGRARRELNGDLSSDAASAVRTPRTSRRCGRGRPRGRSARRALGATPEPPATSSK